mmetsp:Transcript_104776/g.293698  ORF Transcript_104776/g.293698 Transcript_104776/m.293698 type:complete len:289 (+) Transcript_104776:744-1610(+)
MVTARVVGIVTVRVVEMVTAKVVGIIAPLKVPHLIGLHEATTAEMTEVETIDVEMTEVTAGVDVVTVMMDLIDEGTIVVDVEGGGMVAVVLVTWEAEEVAMLVGSDEVAEMVVATEVTAYPDSADHATNLKTSLISSPPMITGAEAVDEEGAEVDKMAQSDLATRKDMMMATDTTMATAMEAATMMMATVIILILLIEVEEEEEEDAVEAEDVAVDPKTEVKRRLKAAAKVVEPKGKPAKVEEMAPIILLPWSKQPLVAEAVMDSRVAAFSVEEEGEEGAVDANRLSA